MTKEEATVLVHHAPPTISLIFRPMDHEFVAMKAAPCPLFVFKSCLVYEHRPFNCRRFGCMRPDVKAEPFEVSGDNMMVRVKTSRIARRMAQRMQRKAQGWAQTHGWKVNREDNPVPVQSLADERRRKRSDSHHHRAE